MGTSSIEFVARIQNNLHDWLLEQNLGPDLSVLLTAITGVIFMLVMAYVSDTIAKLFIRKLIPNVVNRIVVPKRAELWKAALQKHTLARHSSHIAGALVVYYSLSEILAAYPTVVTIVRNLIEAYLILIILVAINAILRSAVDVMRQSGQSTRFPLKFAFQTTQTILWVIGILLIVSVLFDKSIDVLLGSLAGMTAVLMLVFRDSLLGYVAGIQIVNNDLVAEGDWIEIPEFNANGNVIDIGLITIKVQNWDKTLTSIPSYSLINGGFKNWRGMKDSGGRRIKRSLPIDMESIRFCTPEMLARMRKIELLRDYIDDRVKKIEAFNQEQHVDESEPANGRRLTNVGLYRAYLLRYLEHNTAMHKDMTLLVRQLEPSAKGLMIEIYGFSAIQSWVEYETIQSDIIDHAIAVLPTFELKLFQYETLSVNSES
jgi:miniconductance mechanosensitive channel